MSHELSHDALHISGSWWKYMKVKGWTPDVTHEVTNGGAEESEQGGKESEQGGKESEDGGKESDQGGNEGEEEQGKTWTVMFDSAFGINVY